MNIRIITASAGTGKTTRLAELLDQAVSSAAARPEAILATTFTRQAAAELQNRARTRLLRSGRASAAQALLTARIGTVNAVCGSLVTDFSFELGLSPELRVLDEAGAELELKRALASVVSDEVSDQLQGFSGKFDHSFDWHYEIRRLVEAARANGIDSEGLAASAQRSIASLDECLGPPNTSAEFVDAGLRDAIGAALAAISGGIDTTKTTQEYCSFLRECERDLTRGRLRWGDWASLCTKVPAKKALADAGPVRAAAALHLGHPRLRDDLHHLIGLMFDVAARGLSAYQALKRERGLLDFVDQEVLALQLLDRPDIVAMLRGQLDLVLVDEFQDTSPLQLAIFLKLAGVAAQSVWVGDPKQAIFGFRGTDPALMDAAIESLVSPSRDPDLVSAAMDAVSRRSPVETLSTSYRSRPALVEVTNAIFARAFAKSQAMPEERVRLIAERPDSEDLGPAVMHWPLSSQDRLNKSALAQAVAAGARELLEGRPSVWDRETRSYRTALAQDIAILCRTNDQCLLVSEELGKLGVQSVVARVGLLASAEAQVLLASLQLWIDPRDSLAAATLVRIVDNPEDAAAFVEKVLDPEVRERLTSSAPVAAVLALRQQVEDLDVLGVVDALIDVVELRRLCVGWGNGLQRIANLDALRARASRYCKERLAGGDAPSTVGFLSYLTTLVEGGMWAKSRSDTTARVGADEAVTVSTWHAAKGLEWPIVVLYGLESVRQPQAYGVHVLTDRSTFDVSDPLGGRWIHFWPNPYTTSNQNGPVKDAYSQSAAFRQVVTQGQHEALRLLYVGWTRARDRLVFAAQQGKLVSGLMSTFTEIDPGMISDPGVAAPGVVSATWAGHTFGLQVSPHQPTEPASLAPHEGNLRTGRAAVEYPAAYLVPSSAPDRACQMGSPVTLGPPITFRGTVAAEALGQAVHEFFAADDPRRSSAERIAVATGLVERHAVAGSMSTSELIELADRLWRWVKTHFGDACVIRTEWPLGLRLDTGTVALGTADLIVETDDSIAVVDHKSFGLAAAAARANAVAGQLGCYADAAAKAHPTKAISTWLHLPLAGAVIPVTVGSLT